MDAGASLTAGRYTEVPFRARFVYYSSVLYHIILCIHQSVLLHELVPSNVHIIVIATFIWFIQTHSNCH